MQLKHLALTGLAAVALAQEQQPNLTSVLMSTPELSNLTTYVGLFPALLGMLSQARNITILAPSNEAFAELLKSPAGAAIRANQTDLIQAILSYHVLNGTYPASAVMEMPAFLPTMLDNAMFENVTGGQVVEARRDGDMVHFISGLKEESMVSRADVNFTGGVVHIIDKVLTVPQNISTTAVASNLTALAGALTSADLVETLEMAEDVTIFAPSNEAFRNIGSAVGNLTTEQLGQILGYHVVQGTVAYSSTLMNMSVPTLGGPNVTITVVNGTVFVNSAKVIIPDVLVANGVVHVIDNVLNPNMTMATPDPSQSTQAVAFSGASSDSMVPFTSGVATPTSTFAGAAATSASDEAASSTTASGAAGPMKTGSMGMVALMGAGAAFMMV